MGKDHGGTASLVLLPSWLGGFASASGASDPMNDLLLKLRELRIELIAWGAAGIALHWSFSNGFNRYTLAVLILSGAGTLLRDRRRVRR
jgi:hypothetical protein